MDSVVKSAFPIGTRHSMTLPAARERTGGGERDTDKETEMWSLDFQLLTLAHLL